MPHSVSPESETPANAEAPASAEAPEQTMADVPTTDETTNQATSQNEEPEPQNTEPAEEPENDGDVAMDEPEERPSTEAGAAPAETTQDGAESKEGARLEDLFADVDSDDEFPSSNNNNNDNNTTNNNNDNKTSSPAAAPAPSSPPAPAAGPTSLRSSDPELMRTFYQRLFPWRHLFQWLNHGPTPTSDFGHREFAFTMPSDQYWRYQSYATADLLRKDVLRHMPTRFEIGPVYSANPRDRKTLRGNASAFRPVSKELCFDIDLTDYDDVRTCCDKANICRKCWTFVTMAIKVVDAALREDFGFRHVLWVYSGRRGAHAWVCDKKARGLDDQRRRAIAGYLEVVRGGSQAGKRVNVRRPLHPHLSRSLDILAPHFQTTILETQDPWADPIPDEYDDDVLDDQPASNPNARSERLLSLLPDKALNAALRSKWESSPGRSSQLKWGDIDAVARSGASKKLDGRALLEAKQDVVLEHTYPRLDIEVSKKLNHLLKSPFVVHPGTGRVCVPIDTRGDREDGGKGGASVEDFDPLEVPTVQQLVAEIDAWHAKNDDGTENNDGDMDGGGNDEDAKVKKESQSQDASLDDAVRNKRREKKNLQDWEKTSLRPHIEYFRSFVLALMRDETTIKRERDEGEGMEF